MDILLSMVSIQTWCSHSFKNDIKWSGQLISISRQYHSSDLMICQHPDDNGHGHCWSSGLRLATPCQGPLLTAGSGSDSRVAAGSGLRLRSQVHQDQKPGATFYVIRHFSTIQALFYWSSLLVVKVKSGWLLTVWYLTLRTTGPHFHLKYNALWTICMKVLLLNIVLSFVSLSLKCKL